MSLRALVKAIETVPELEGKVFPVVVPAKMRDWPVCLYARAGGLLDETTRGAAVQPGVRVEIIAGRYEDVDRVMQAARRALVREGLYQIPDPPVDVYDEDLSVFRQAIHVILVEER